MTQLVQEYTVRAQVRALCKKTGVRIDRTEHVANSLGHLAAVVEQLNSLDNPLKVQLVWLLYCETLCYVLVIVDSSHISIAGKLTSS